MDVVQTLIAPAVLLFFGSAGVWFLKDRMERLERRIDDLPTRVEVDGRFAAVESRLERLEAESLATRSDLTQVALAVGARPRPQTG